ncbi:hypothetical protein AX17_000213 [Amanita inopinata Kibby_2008]|nr:hypothetical protein AX17_000213 [Amanita inopinata Kibby_2008]
MNSNLSSQLQPPALPATAPPQSAAFYNPHPSQPLRLPQFSYPAAPNPGIVSNLYQPPHSAPVGGGGALVYYTPTVHPHIANTVDQSNDSNNHVISSTAADAASYYLPPNMLYQRLYDIGRTRSRRKSQSNPHVASSQTEGRGRSKSKGGSATGDRSHSRGQSRTRKPWWNFP